MFDRIKKSTAVVVNSVRGAFAQLSKMGQGQQRLIALIAKRESAIEKVKSKFATQIEKAENQQRVAFEKIYDFVNRNKATFSVPGSRSRTGDCGHFGIRSTTPKVELNDGVDESVLIKSMLKGANQKYVRITYSLDREAMLKDRPDIKGVTYSQHDEIFAKPAIPKESGKSKTLSLDVKV